MIGRTELKKIAKFKSDASHTITQQLNLIFNIFNNNYSH